MKKLLIISLFTFSSAFFTLCSAQYTDLFNFNGTNGSEPRGNLLLSGSVLYGMTYIGGANDSGCVFSIDTNGNSYKDMFDFSGSNGVEPWGATFTLLGNKLYGMTAGEGSAPNYGNIFSIDTSGSGYEDLFEFNGTNGVEPWGSTLTFSGNKLYGMTLFGGASGAGNIFSIDTNGSGYNDLLDFNYTNGAYPGGSLTLSGGTLYGMTGEGGVNNQGNVFSIDTNGNGFRDLWDFDDTGINGSEPNGSFILIGSKLYGMTPYGGTSSDGVIFSIDTSGHGYTDLFNFNGTNGRNPSTNSLTFSGGKLYGMTNFGGTVHDSGCIFSIDTNGSEYTELLNFNGTNGARPNGSLTIFGNTLYGVTRYGGANGDGLVFSFRDTTINTTTSVNTISTTPEIGVKVYPNPSNGVFTIQSSVASSQSTIEIYNMLGEQVKSETLRGTSNEIDLGFHPSGVYFYRVLTEEGNLVGEGKLVIQK